MNFDINNITKQGEFLTVDTYGRYELFLIPIKRKNIFQVRLNFSAVDYDINISTLINTIEFNDTKGLSLLEDIKNNSCLFDIIKGAKFEQFDHNINEIVIESPTYKLLLDKINNKRVQLIDDYGDFRYTRRIDDIYTLIDYMNFKKVVNKKQSMVNISIDGEDSINKFNKENATKQLHIIYDMIDDVCHDLNIPDAEFLEDRTIFDLCGRKLVVEYEYLYNPYKINLPIVSDQSLTFFVAFGEFMKLYAKHDIKSKLFSISRAKQNLAKFVFDNSVEGDEFSEYITQGYNMLLTNISDAKERGDAELVIKINDIDSYERVLTIYKLNSRTRSFNIKIENQDFIECDAKISFNDNISVIKFLKRNYVVLSQEQ